MEQSGKDTNIYSIGNFEKCTYEDCAVYTLDKPNGKIRITVYEVFPGIKLEYKEYRLYNLN